MNRITTRWTVNLRTGRGCREWYWSSKPLAYCKGATDQQKQLEQSQAAFYDLLTKDYSIQFGKQQAILSALTASAEQILAKGPSQEGFSAAEKTALMTQAKEGTARDYNQAQKAVQGAEASAGGGNEFLPSGVNAQINAGVAETAAESEASKELSINQADYERGYQLWLNSANILNQTSAQYNPVGFAGAANQGGSAASQTANEIQQADAAASPWGAIGGIVGGGLSAFLGNPSLLSGGGKPHSGPSGG